MRGRLGVTGEKAAASVNAEHARLSLRSTCSTALPLMPSAASSRLHCARIACGALPRCQSTYEAARRASVLGEVRL